MWLGKTPNSDTPPGATHAFNRAYALKDCRIVGIGIAEDTLNRGEYVTYLLVLNEETGEEFSVSAWVDEERTRPGWMEIRNTIDPVCG